MRSLRLIPALPLLACGGGSPPGGNRPPPGDDDAPPARHDDAAVGGADAPPPPGADAIAPPYDVCAAGDAAHDTLAAAIADAPDAAVLTICPGTYAETLVIDARRLSLLAEPGSVIVDGGGAGTVITLSGGADVELVGLVVRGGRAGLGGGIRCTDSALRADRVTITDSQATDDGGGLYARECQLHVIRSVIAGNHADKGAGLYLDSDASIEDSRVADNHADWVAGGIYITGHAPLVRNNDIEGNTSVDDGGGLYLDQSRAMLVGNRIVGNHSVEDGGGVRVFTGYSHLESNEIIGNRAGADGGGVKASHLPTQMIANDIRDNVAGGYGGGLELDNDSSTVRGGIIADNQASAGGGIHGSLFADLGAVIEDVQVVGNVAQRGAGIYLEENFAPVTLRRLVVANNRGERGGGIAIRRTRFALSNSLLAGNRAASDGGGLLIGNDDVAVWTKPCPCPPSSATGTIDFVVVHAGAAGAGAAMWLRSPALEVSNSILSANGAAAVKVVGTAPAWRYSNAMPADFTGMADPTGTNGNLARDPRFVDATSGDFHLDATSPCVDAGDPTVTDRDASRADMGFFGGPDAP